VRTNSRSPLRFAKSPLIARNYPTTSIKGETDDLYSIMEFVENLFPDRAIIVCRRSETPSVYHASANCKKIFGYDAAAVKRLSLPDFLALVHPEDISEVEQCFAFINASEPYDPVLYRFELHYRMKHKKGHYIHVADQKMAMKYGDGYIYINSIKDETSQTKFHDVKMNIYQYVRQEFRQVQTFIPRLSQSDLTPRQKDIVNLIDKGFTNREIAEQLSVSVNTIKNHKSLLFRKVNVKNTIELLNVARSGVW